MYFCVPPTSLSGPLQCQQLPFNHQSLAMRRTTSSALSGALLLTYSNWCFFLFNRVWQCAKFCAFFVSKLKTFRCDVITNVKLFSLLILLISYIFCCHDWPIDLLIRRVLLPICQFLSFQGGEIAFFFLMCHLRSILQITRIKFNHLR